MARTANSDSGANRPALRALDSERKPPLGVLATERLREAIVFGRLKLGEAVSEDRLAALLNVSRTPVREALTALQMQGLVVIQPQRGSYVFQPTERDVADLCEFRRMVETHALRLAYAKGTSELGCDLAEAQARMEQAELNANALLAAKADEEFHNAFFAHCGNRILVESYALVSGRIGAVRFFARGSSGSREASSAGHRAIIRAIAARDLDTAETVLSKHIMNMQLHFSEALRTRAGLQA
jgi:DNA-binding GntR family transcriptional regulator